MENLDDMTMEQHSAGTALALITTDHPSEETAALGRIISELLQEEDFMVDGVIVVPNEEHDIRQALETGVVGGVDLMVTIGGVGMSPRHHTPDATTELIDRFLPGISEALRTSGLAAGAKDAVVSRGVVGISGSTMIANLADSRVAVRDGMATLLPMARYVIEEISRVS